jgi:hypothetical protein
MTSGSDMAMLKYGLCLSFLETLRANFVTTWGQLDEFDHQLWNGTVREYVDMTLQYWISLSTLQLFSTGRTPKGSRDRVASHETRGTGLDS